MVYFTSRSFVLYKFQCIRHFVMPSTVMISNFRKSTRTPDVDFKGDFQAGLHPSRTSEHNRSDHDSRTQPTAVGQQASDEQKQLHGVSLAQCQQAAFEKSVEQGDNSNYLSYSTTFLFFLAIRAFLHGIHIISSILETVVIYLFFHRGRASRWS